MYCKTFNSKFLIRTVRWLNNTIEKDKTVCNNYTIKHNILFGIDFVYDILFILNQFRGQVFTNIYVYGGKQII